MITADTRPSAAERLAQAESARDDGIATVEHAADPRIILAIDAAIENAIASGRRFSANDIRDQFPVSNEHLVGARMRGYASRRVDGHPLMVRAGFTPSSLKSTHAHEIKVWLGFRAWAAANRAAAAAQYPSYSF